MTSGLVLCCLAVDYVSLSKRFLPELVNFLLGILHLAVRDKTSLGLCTLSAPRGEGGSARSYPAFKPSLRCRLHCGAAFQGNGEINGAAGAVGLGVLQELEQERSPSVHQPEPGPTH